jgi:hypothetical protein
MRLLGKRIMLNRPEEKKSSIKVSEAQQRELDLELMKEWTKLTVFAVGDEVQTIHAGDKVYAYVNSLANAEVLEVDGSKKIIVSLPEIVVVW